LTEYSGGGDPTLSMQLLWGTREPPTRGPKPGLELGAIVAAATTLADAQGLGELSMRKVAQELAVGTMSLYRYVPGKAELLDLMLDAAYGEMLQAEGPTATPASDSATPASDSVDPTSDSVDPASDSDDPASDSAGSGDPAWRTALTRVVQRYRAMYLRHPWILQFAISRPPLGPNVMEAYDRDLRALEGSGLTDLEMDAVISLVAGFVQSTARGAVDVMLAEQRTGLTDRQWWEVHAPLLGKVFDPERYPLAARIGAAAGEANQAAYDPQQAFNFGLARILDGIAVLIDTPNRKLP
jgi:AcrR family transcriptional regulator